MYLSYKFCFLKLNCGSTIDEDDYLILTKPDEQVIELNSKTKHSYDFVTSFDIFDS